MLNDPLAPAKEQKLPAWAQKTINDLRAKLDTARACVQNLEAQRDTLEARIAEAAEADTGPEDSTAWLYRDTPAEVLPSLGLGADAVIDFRPADGIEITVNAHGNGIKVTALQPMMVIPIDRGEFRIQPVSAKIKG